MAKMANLESQHINGVLGIWYNGEIGKLGKSTDQQRFLVPIQKILRMASLANLESQQINGVWLYGIMANLANLENQQINIDFCTHSKTFENGEFGEFGKSTDQLSFRYMV